jgi:hypothetical protein
MNAKRPIFFTILLLYTITLAAQQNFFNVPSSDITEKHKIFFQQQFNCWKSGIQSNTTMSYGLGKEFEIGLNFFGLTYSLQNKKFLYEDDDIPYAPILGINAQKKIQITKHYALALGTQLLWNRKYHGAFYNYLNNVCSFHTTKLVAGLYECNDGFIGAQTRNITEDKSLRQLGFHIGVEQKIWHDKLLFQAEFISGKHSLGEAVIGGAYLLNDRSILSLGYQIPTFASHAIKAFVVEFTIVPKKE